MSSLQSVKKITAVFQNDLPARLPFDQHPLKQEDDYTKELYCTMLAVIIQCEHTPEFEQTIFFKRLIQGVNIDITFEQFMQKALKITEQFPKDFYDQLNGQPIFKNFIIDALVMMNCKEKMNKNQFSFLAELLSVFQISEKSLREWSTFAKNIVTQNKEAIFKYVEDYANFKNLQLFAYYDIDHNNHYYLKNGDIHQIDAMMNSDPEVILLEECRFTEDLLSYVIHSKKLVHFKNCHFEAIPNPLQFLNIHALIFEECEFCNFSDTVMVVEGVESIILKKCVVKNMEYSNYQKAIFIGGKEVKEVMIIESQFENINYNNDYDNYGVLLKLNRCKIHLVKNNFKKINAKGYTHLFSLENRYSWFFSDVLYKENFDVENFVEKRTLESYVKEELNLGGNQHIQVNNEFDDCNYYDFIEGV